MVIALTSITEVVGSIPSWNSEIFSVVPSPVAKQVIAPKPGAEMAYGEQMKRAIYFNIMARLYTY